MLNDNDYPERMRALLKKYPYQFSRTFDFSVPHGWMDAVEMVCAQIDLLLTHHNVNKANFSWRQLKEKLGGLRLYWERSWSPPEATKRAHFYLDEFVLPDDFTVPEDPNWPADVTYNSKEWRDYVDSDSHRAWVQQFMIPNPEIAKVPRDTARYFENVCQIDFADKASDDELERVTLAVAREIMLPANVTEAIRTFVEVAEVRAGATCQICGEAGKLINSNGWYHTACEDHSK
jgi:hypothetical protein